MIFLRAISHRPNNVDLSSSRANCYFFQGNKNALAIVVGIAAARIAG
jgi:hypothetical protein